MKQTILCILLLATVAVNAQQSTIKVAENLVAEGIPPLPLSLVRDVSAYTEVRSASLSAWHPVKKEMLIATRFGNTPQLHWVKMPGGVRKQITFFDEPVSSASFQPVKGDYFYTSVMLVATSSGRSTALISQPENQH